VVAGGALSASPAGAAPASGSATLAVVRDEEVVAARAATVEGRRPRPVPSAADCVAMPGSERPAPSSWTPGSVTCRTTFFSVTYDLPVARLRSGPAPPGRG